MNNPTRRAAITTTLGAAGAVAIGNTVSSKPLHASSANTATNGADDASIKAAAYPLNDLVARNAETDSPYLRFFDNNTMSAGLYELKAGSTDGQSPHALDEFYVVLKGRSKFIADGETYNAEPGAILFVKAHVEHRFFDIEEDLQIAVFFSKAAP